GWTIQRQDIIRHHEARPERSPCARPLRRKLGQIRQRLLKHIRGATRIHPAADDRSNTARDAPRSDPLAASRTLVSRKSLTPPHHLEAFSYPPHPRPSMTGSALR